MDAISRLCTWYERQCTDEWHEDHGVSIETLDNPGWRIKVDLEGTSIEAKPFQEIEINRSDRDWVVARRHGNIFEAFGGPKNLGEMIEAFLSWAD